MPRRVSEHYLSKVNISPEYTGMQPTLNSFFAFNSAQRGAMGTKNTHQWLILPKGGEHPTCNTGFASIFADYEFDEAIQDTGIHILYQIPLYRFAHGENAINSSPFTTIIGQRYSDGKITTFDIKTYRQLADGFGYMYAPVERHHLASGEIPPNTRFHRSPATMIDNEYHMGINLKMAAITLSPLAEDGYVISDKVAERCATTAMHTIGMHLDLNKIPLDLRGDGVSYKFMPDIGELVGDKGILMAFRAASRNGILTEYTPEALREINPLHDIMIPAPPGATVIDIRVSINPAALRNKFNLEVFQQLHKYWTQQNQYYLKLIQIYEELKGQGHSFTREFNSLVRHAYTQCIGKENKIRRGKQLKEISTSKRDRISFAYLKITYMYERPVKAGNKVSGMHGDKGVIADIWPEEYMPIDAQGIRADILKISDAVINRMNLGQLYEQFFNRMSTLIIQRCAHMDKLAAFEYVMSYLDRIDIDYVKTIRFMYQGRETDFVDLIISTERIILHIAPSLKTINFMNCLRIAHDFQYVESPVTFTYRVTAPNRRHHTSARYRTVTTKDTVAIGSQYIYILNKIPDIPTATEAAYVSQFGIPTKNKAAKHRSINQTPIRFGEDEWRILLMCIAPELATRLLCSAGNSPQDTQELIYQLLVAEKPAAFDGLDIRTEDMIKRSIPLGLVQHMLAAGGCDIGSRLYNID